MASHTPFLVCCSANSFILHALLPPASGEELLARPQLHQGGTGGQRHQAHQRSWHPRGVSLWDHVRGAESNHAGHPHRRAGDHRGGGDSVHGGRAGTEVKKKKNSTRQTKQRLYFLLSHLDFAQIYQATYQTYKNTSVATAAGPKSCVLVLFFLVS